MQFPSLMEMPSRFLASLRIVYSVSITQQDYVHDILGKATVEIPGNWESAPGISQVQGQRRCVAAPPRRASLEARRRRTSRIVFSLIPSTRPNCPRNTCRSSKRLGSFWEPSPHFDRAQSISFGTGSPVHSHFSTSCDECSCIWSGAPAAASAGLTGFPVKCSTYSYRLMSRSNRMTVPVFCRSHPVLQARPR
jgi:hypothetical protein